jgi:hypothetical protein
MKKKLYIILGKPNSHKSSVMRCLTGCSVTRGNWSIKLKNGQDEKFFISISSPQERGGKGLSVTEFITEMCKTQENNLVITLQSKSSTKQPDGEIYLQAFIEAGFEIQPVVCFDSNANLLNLQFQMFNTRNTPPNQTAAEVREIWGLN